MFGNNKDNVMIFGKHMTKTMLNLILRNISQIYFAAKILC